MSAEVVRLNPLVRSGWSPRELGEFYRAESALIQAGLRIETGCGLSDEGDPWFVFCRADDGEVIVHIARIQGIYTLAGPSYAAVASGRDITALVRDLIKEHPLVQKSGQSRGSNILLHPAALLIAVVAAAFFKGSEAHAFTPDHSKLGENRGGGRLEPVTTSETQKTILVDAGQSAMVISAIASVLVDEIITVDKAVYAPNSDLLDSSFLTSSVSSTGFSHAVDLVSFLPDGHEGPFSFPTIESPAAAHSGAITDAIPLYTLLWDLAKTTVPVGTPAQRTGDSFINENNTTSNENNTTNVILSVTLAPSHTDGLPNVQSASLSAPLHAGPADPHAPSGNMTTLTIETQSPSQLGQLSSALMAALREASHTLIVLPEGGTTPFANAIINIFTTHGLTSANSNPNQLNSTSIELYATNNNAQADTASGSVSSSNSLSGSTSISQAPTDGLPGQHPSASSSMGSIPAVENVEMLVQEFFAHTANYQTMTQGSHVLVYDTVAISSHASELVSVTFDFSDGSTLSLVGLPAALHHSVIA